MSGSPRATSSPDSESEKKHLEDLKTEFLDKLEILGLERDSDLFNDVTTQVNTTISLDDLNGAEITLHKAIFALDVLSKYNANIDADGFNFPKEFLCGAHFVVEDDGKLYETMADKRLGGVIKNSESHPLADDRLTGNRFSSHYPTTRQASDVSFQAFPIISEFLIGKATKNGKTITWFQTEGHPMMDVKNILLHGVDLIVYITTGRNVGFYGTSEYTEKGTSIILTQKPEEDLRVDHAVEAEKLTERRMAAVTKLEEQRAERIAAMQENKGKLNLNDDDRAKYNLLLEAVAIGDLDEVFTPTTKGEEKHHSAGASAELATRLAKFKAKAEAPGAVTLGGAAKPDDVERGGAGGAAASADEKGTAAAGAGGESLPFWLRAAYRYMFGGGEEAEEVAAAKAVSATHEEAKAKNGAPEALVVAGRTASGRLNIKWAAPRSTPAAKPRATPKSSLAKQHSPRHK